MLSFASYAKIVKVAIPSTDEVLVNLLVGCIYEPLELTMGKKKESFYLDTKNASYYLNPNSNPDRPIHREIIIGSGESKVVNSAIEYFQERVCSQITPAMEAEMIDKLSQVISLDASITTNKKAELLKLASKDTVAEFLSSILLYVVNKPNFIVETITEHNNLPPQNPFFSGRIDQLANINQFLSKKGNAVNIKQIIAGLGGIGKTQLAIEYAYRYCYAFKNCIWFVNAETPTTTQNYFLEFANHFKLPLSQDYTSEDLQKAVSVWLNANKDWLLVFDNLETADVITPYLPQKYSGRIIITTRSMEVDLGQQIILGVFDMDEAIEFLKRRFSKDDELKMEFYSGNDFEAEAPKLAERLGLLPLALEQAAAYIKKVKCSIASYLKLLSESGLLAFEEEQSSPTHYNKENKFERIVTATWRVSFANIANEGARQLLNLCAYMAPDKIPVSFFADMREKLPSPIKENMGDELFKNRIVSELRTYSLTSGDANFINVHRLVQEVVRKSHTDEDPGIYSNNPPS